MISVDFHCHTNASRDSICSPQNLIRFARKKHLDRIVVTDHNTIKGALTAFSIDPSLVIIGEEIKTTKGELLAAFVVSEIPGGLDPEITIQLLRDQGAFISVSHPFDSRNGAWKFQDLIKIIPLIDAVEVFNSRCMLLNANRKAREFSEKYSLPGTAGSDAHSPSEIGNGYVILPQFCSTEELKSSIKNSSVKGRMAPIWVHFISQYARITKMIANEGGS